MPTTTKKLWIYYSNHAVVNVFMIYGRIYFLRKLFVYSFRVTHFFFGEINFDLWDLHNKPTNNVCMGFLCAVRSDVMMRIRQHIFLSKLDDLKKIAIAVYIPSNFCLRIVSQSPPSLEGIPMVSKFVSPYVIMIVASWKQFCMSNLIISHF